MDRRDGPELPFGVTSGCRGCSPHSRYSPRVLNQRVSELALCGTLPTTGFALWLMQHLHSGERGGETFWLYRPLFKLGLVKAKQNLAETK